MREGQNVKWKSWIRNSRTGSDFRKVMYSIHTGPDAMSAPASTCIRNKHPLDHLLFNILVKYIRLHLFINYCIFLSTSTCSIFNILIELFSLRNLQFISKNPIQFFLFFFLGKGRKGNKSYTKERSSSKRSQLLIDHATARLKRRKL